MEIMIEAVGAIRQSDKTSGSLKIQKLAGDASLRQYFRVFSKDRSYVLMLVEPFSEAENNFLLIRDLLEQTKVPCPGVCAIDGAAGAILLEDLGDSTMLHEISKNGSPDQEEKLFKESIDLLVTFHKNTQVTPAMAAKIPGYGLAFDVEKLMWEVDFTFEHLFQNYLKRTIDSEQHGKMRASFVDICERLAREPRVFTHRDYHSRNIMIPEGGEMHAIDFQDARMGLRQYDLASILRDSYYQLTEERVYSLVNYYIQQVENREGLKLDSAHFIRLFDLMSIQRNFKAIGSFTMFYAKRNDPMYLRFVGNTFENIRRNLLKFPEYMELRKALFQFYYF